MTGSSKAKLESGAIKAVKSVSPRKKARKVQPKSDRSPREAIPNKYETIDDYIMLFPGDVGQKLTAIRNLVKELAPGASEKISYGVPTFFLNGNLVHFAAFTKHVSFFPSSSGVEAFRDELGNYKTSKGTIQFPLDKPLPMELIKKIVLFRIEENTKKPARKR